MGLVNLNRQVRVTLTPRGIELWHATWCKPGCTKPMLQCVTELPGTLAMERNTWDVRMELHAFANLFGPYLTSGGTNLPCETDIIVLEER